MSIKNQVVTLIAYIYVHNNLAIKTLHHAVNIISTKAELFAIRYSINQATQLANINCIVVIIDLLLSQTSFSLCLHNQWTDFHRLSCVGKL